MGRVRRLLVRLAGSSVLLLLMLAAAGAGAWFALWFLAQSSQVSVPDLTDATEEAARKRAASIGLVLEIATERYDRRIGAGRILEQDPAPGSLTRPGRTLRVIVSLGEEEIEVPQLTGRPAREAQLELQRLGLKPGSASFVHWTDPPDRVIAQQPAAGARRARGERVDFLVSRGSRPRTYVMPDLRGRAEGSGRAMLERSGLRPPATRHEVRRGVPSGIIVDQHPSAGEPVHERQAISLTVSQ